MEIFCVHLCMQNQLTKHSRKWVCTQPASWQLHQVALGHATAQVVLCCTVWAVGRWCANNSWLGFIKPTYCWQVITLKSRHTTTRSRMPTSTTYVYDEDRLQWLQYLWHPYKVLGNILCTPAGWPYAIVRQLPSAAKICGQMYIQCLKTNGTDVAHYSFNSINAHQPILVIFVRDIALRQYAIKWWQWYCFGLLYLGRASTNFNNFT